MRHFLLFWTAVLLPAAPFAARAADLVLPDGRKFADFQVKKVMSDAILIAYRNDRGEPDAAEIPFRYLPEDVRRLYPAAAVTPVPAASAPTAAPANAPAGALI